jgi:hypothetical protein
MIFEHLSISVHGQTVQIYNKLPPPPSFHIVQTDIQTESMVEGRTIPSSTCAKINVESTIFDFGFSKKFDLSLLSTLGQVLDRCRAFDLFVSVDAQSSTFQSFRS